ncbi:MAG: signal peptidase I [Pirellulales bacterium]
MSPTILPGDRILVDKSWCEPTSLRRNDVVVFRSAGPDSPLYVMRLVGLPGDQIEIANEKVLLNGEEWPAPLLLVSFTERGKDVVRIISARKATKRERRDYEQGTCS